MDRSSGIGDARAFQLALELSMLGISDPLSSVSEPDSPADLGSFVNSLTSVGLEEVRSKKSQNMTECVPVPSSEHVAEIVGRQGNFSQHFTISSSNHHISTFVHFDRERRGSISCNVIFLSILF